MIYAIISVLVLAITILSQRQKIKSIESDCIQICVRHANEKREWMDKEMQYLNKISDLNMQIPCDQSRSDK
jgi:hypothetical protein